MVTQLALSGIQLKDFATFDNFYCAEDQQLVGLLQQFSRGHGEPFFYLWGNTGAGRSHLLQACCHYANENGMQTMYLPLTLLAQAGVDILDNIESLSMICIDDIDEIAGNCQWEEALFHVYNRVKAADKRLLISAACAPRELALQLADLRSRLSWGMVFQVQGLSDHDKIAALKLRGKARGMLISDEIGQFLLRRCPRNMIDLFAILEKLDHASIAAKRRLTIPFVKSVLGV